MWGSCPLQAGLMEQINFCFSQFSCMAGCKNTTQSLNASCVETDRIEVAMLIHTILESAKSDMWTVQKLHIDIQCNTDAVK